MKLLDRVIRSLRIRQARPFIRPGSRVLDIGCGDGSLFGEVPGIAEGVGIDPEGTVPDPRAVYRFFKGRFPDDLPSEEGRFDVITLLAVLEHIPAERERTFIAACDLRLKPGGRVVVTVPSPAVDDIVRILIFLRLADGIDCRSHRRLDRGRLEGMFKGAGLMLTRKKPFQLGLNHLFVFEKKHLI